MLIRFERDLFSVLLGLNLAYSSNFSFRLEDSMDLVAGEFLFLLAIRRAESLILHRLLGS